MTYWMSLLPALFDGLKLSLTVYFFTLVCAIPLGFLGALLSQTKIPGIQKIMDTFTWLIRGTPLLLQLYFVFFALPILFNFSIRNTRLHFAIITFVINYTAYFIEIFKSGFVSIDRGQWEVSQMLEMTKTQTLFSVIIPQVLRRTMHVIGNEAITLVKDTSLLAAVALPDLLMVSKEALSRDVRVDAILISALFYLIFTFIVVRVVKTCLKSLKVENPSL